MSQERADRALFFPLADPAETTPLVSATEAEVVGLFEELRDSLFRYLLSFRLLPHDCEDLIQEVFLALFTHLQRGRSRAHLRAWVFRVAHNQGLKRHYQNRRRQQNQVDSTHLDEHADSALNVEEQMVLNERQSRLLSAFEALPEQDRYCLRLRAEGLTYREIAEVLGVSLGSVAQYLSRSLARLARADRR
ncbi:MAG: sigma-70 family RNA polymerase sigma factor [Acidobacteria bacterium]|nr:sigma-70 family RNA polymerase sigma factor [Acidobacteriota bacterium]